jgi:hypothetical protein
VCKKGGREWSGEGQVDGRQRVTCGLWLAGLRVSPTSVGRPVVLLAGVRMDTENG